MLTSPLQKEAQNEEIKEKKRKSTYYNIQKISKKEN